MKTELTEKINMFRTFNDITLKNEIVVYGSTYTAEFPFYELSKKYLLNNAIYNRSIRGLTLADAEEYLTDCVLNIRPSKIFLALGDCDLDNPSAMTIYRRILRKIQEKLPDAHLYVLSVALAGDRAKTFNNALCTLCRETGAQYLDICYPSGGDAHPYSRVFKQMTRFFRDTAISFTDALLLAGN
ncbi:MAG: SGNH/GDSL hydrolase family protein [Eubacteriales bacterium]